MRKNVTITVKPSRWDRENTDRRRAAPFRANWTETTRLLKQECRAIEGYDVMLLLEVRQCDIKRNGFVYSDAKPDHPGAQVVMSTKHGQLRYACDCFEDWRDNVRAIALTLERLRKAEAYGVVERGEQYAGFAALPEPEAFDGKVFSLDEGAEWLGNRTGINRFDILDDPDDFLRAYRQAAKNMHPDKGGSPEDFKALQRVRKILEEHHAGVRN